MQAIAVRAASNRPAEVVGEAGQGVDPGLLVRMLRQGLFLASIAIDLVGFVAQLIALRQLPLFAVQAIMAANLAVTAVFAAWIMKARLALREWLAVVGVVVGVALLGLSAGAQGASKVGPAFQLGLIAAVFAVGVGGFAVARLPNPVRTPALGATAYTLAAAGIVSFLLYATALEGGSVTTATAAVVLAETMPPALIGVIFLGDTTRRGLAPVGVLGFLLAVVCAVALARFGEASESHRADPHAPETAEVGESAGRRAALRDRLRFSGQNGF
jgi:drug/metabolite transporter (DMT)-like permease